MEFEERDREIYEFIEKRNKTNRQIGENTYKAFNMLKTYSIAFVDKMKQWQKDEKIEEKAVLEYTDKGKWEFYLRFSSDLLVFTMHTNIFEFSRNHEVMKTLYIKEDKTRSYCGVIHIYNFLSDSVIYRRPDDAGYLIGRVFINKENHYFIEGKQELGLIYSQFDTSLFDETACRNLIRSSMEYTTHFDLLTPPYDEIKEISVAYLENDSANKQMIMMKTGKRLGFKFQADGNV